MEWVAVVAGSVGLGFLAGWIYAGFPGLRRFRAMARRGEQRSRAPASEGSDRLTKATLLLTRDLLEAIQRRST